MPKCGQIGMGQKASHVAEVSNRPEVFKLWSADQEGSAKDVAGFTRACQKYSLTPHGFCINRLFGPHQSTS